jgi:hypothetical protein
MLMLPSGGLSRQPSLSASGIPGLNRSLSSFVNDFIDTSASLDSAPPPDAIPSAVPPSLRVPQLSRGASFDLLADLSADAVGESFAAPPQLSRRSSPRLAAPPSPRPGQ